MTEFSPTTRESRGITPAEIDLHMSELDTPDAGRARAEALAVAHHEHEAIPPHQAIAYTGLRLVQLRQFEAGGYDYDLAA